MRFPVKWPIVKLNMKNMKDILNAWIKEENIKEIEHIKYLEEELVVHLCEP